MTTRDAAGARLLEVRDLEVHFPIHQGLLLARRVGEVRAVDGVSFSVTRGETLGLVGESGSGKSTTGRAVLRITRPTGGSLIFDGVDITHLGARDLRPVRKRMQMIFQDPYTSLDPRMRAGSIIAEPLDIHGVGTPRERRERVHELLATVGLQPEHATRYPHEFSGGQRQRIGVARALALEPDLIVADEPISALDVSIQAQVLNLFKRIQERMGLTYIFIAHDLAAVRHVSDRIAVMYLGRIVEIAPASSLTRQPSHPYTIALLSAIPVPDPRAAARRRRIILVGEVPSAAAPPPGCRFHTRCWLREQLGRPIECETIDPPPTEVAPGHVVACHHAAHVAGSTEQLASAAHAAPPSQAPQPQAPGAA